MYIIILTLVTISVVIWAIIYDINKMIILEKRITNLFKNIIIDYNKFRKSFSDHVYISGLIMELCYMKLGNNYKVMNDQLDKNESTINFIKSCKSLFNLIAKYNKLKYTRRDITCDEMIKICEKNKIEFEINIK